MDDKDKTCSTCTMTFSTKSNRLKHERTNAKCGGNSSPSILSKRKSDVTDSESDEAKRAKILAKVDDLAIPSMLCYFLSFLSVYMFAKK